MSYKSIRTALLTITFVFMHHAAQAQERTVLVPKPVPGSPFHYEDTEDLFGKAYRWFLEGAYPQAADTLRKLIEATGFELEPDNYYIIVPNFTDKVTPIGLFYKDQDYFKRWFYGLKEDNLYYIYLSRQREGHSFVSVLA
ncbi:MAG: hypothetical protein GF313_15865, partial [Caldithrix sp.]|nr:hypothetical protein [Caldithrix sp.]